MLMTRLITQDGTCVIVDPEAGVITAPSREEAEAELRRRKPAPKPPVWTPWGSTRLSEGRG